MRIGRIAAVTAGLVAAGAVAGAVVSMAVGLFLAPPSIWSLRPLLVFGVEIGAPAGAVLAPVAAWLLMRHVQLGRAIGGTALGTLAGAGLGALLVGPQQFIFMGSVLGFGAAAVYLRVRTPREARRFDAGDARVRQDGAP